MMSDIQCIYMYIYIYTHIYVYESIQHYVYTQYIYLFTCLQISKYIGYIHMVLKFAPHVMQHDHINAFDVMLESVSQ